MIKIIFDTDIGDDIDDAFALALAGSLKKLDIIAVTTVFRETQLRAKQAKKLLETIGLQEVPVYAGIKQPIKEQVHLFERDKVNDRGIIEPCQYDESYEDMFVSEVSAVDLIIEQVKENPKEIVMVCVGPLTNIAMALKKEPKLKDLLDRIVIMGGSFQVTRPEWNIYCDPEAADIVFRSGVDVFCVGLDVTLQCTLEEDLLADFKKQVDPRTKLLNTWFERWVSHFNFKKSVMHDPLAVATLVSDVCSFNRFKVAVDLLDNRGAIRFDEEKGTEVYVATKVNKDMFYDLFRQQLIQST